MASKFSLGGMCVAAALAFTASSANAATVLAFGQSTSGRPVAATANNGNGAASTQTTIAATAVPITITEIFGDVIPTPASALFSLTATSTGAATGSGGVYSQNYNGSFSITNGSTNYLSGTFTGMTMTISAAAVLFGSTPTNTVNFTSDLFPVILTPRSVSFSLSGLTPTASLCGTTLCSFTASVAGTISGEPVPEPATWGMMILGFGAMGFAMRRRQRLSVRFA